MWSPGHPDGLFNVAQKPLITVDTGRLIRRVHLKKIEMTIVQGQANATQRIVKAGWSWAGVMTIVAMTVGPAWATTQTQDIALPIAEPAKGLSSVAHPDAATIFSQMGHFLEKQQTFYVEINSTTTIRSGSTSRQSGGLSRVWFRRPGHVVWTTESDFGASALAIDGENCTLYLPSLSRYTVTPADPTPDRQLASMTAPYGIITSSLFHSTPSAALAGAISAPPTLAGEETILGVDSARLGLTTPMGSGYMWVARGMIPLPVKLVYEMNIPAAPGENNAIHSQTEVSFRWRVNVDLPTSTFKLNIPDTAVKADRLGVPMVTAQLKSSGGSRNSGRSGSSSKSSSSSSRNRSRDSSKPGRTSDNKPLGLAYEPPPNLDQPVPLRSALQPGDPGSLPSLQGSDDVVRAAINSSKPDAVPSGASYQPTRERQAPPPASSASLSPAADLILLDGQRLSLSAYKGHKVVVLDFWATWCGPCRQSLPVVSQLAQNYRSRGVEFFAVNMAENDSEIRRFLQQNGIQLPIAIDPNGSLASSFGVTGIPHLVIIGKDGTIKATHTGADHKLAEKLSRDLNLALQ